LNSNSFEERRSKPEFAALNIHHVYLIRQNLRPIFAFSTFSLYTNLIFLCLAAIKISLASVRVSRHGIKKEDPSTILCHSMMTGTPSLRIGILWCHVIHQAQLRVKNLNCIDWWCIQRTAFSHSLFNNCATSF